jgi:hypothetical protein
MPQGYRLYRINRLSELNRFERFVSVQHPSGHAAETVCGSFEASVMSESGSFVGGSLHHAWRGNTLSCPAVAPELDRVPMLDKTAPPNPPVD